MGEKIRDRVKELRRVRAGDLIPNPRNWRKHPPEQAAALKGALEEIGYAGALLARETPDGVCLIDGHLRAETTPDAMVPVLILDVTEAEADKLLLTFDPLAAMAEKNQEAFDALARDVDIQTAALRKMVDEQMKVMVQGECDADAVPETVEPVSKPGDLWVLGDHRLLCGDSTKAEDVARVMGGEKAGLCFTSPPYAQQRDYGKKITDWDGLMRGVFGNLPMADDGQVLVNLGLVHREGEWWPYWDGWIEWMREQGWRRFGWYVWDKGFGMCGDWSGRCAPAHEFIFHFNRVSVKPAHCIPKASRSIGRGNDKHTFRQTDGSLKNATSPDAMGNTHKIPDSVWRSPPAHTAGQVEAAHPAVYPVAICEVAMNAWNGISYEPFSGSGTTIIAAEQLGRRCMAIEIEPKYCDVAVARFEKFTGKKAVRG